MKTNYVELLLNRRNEEIIHELRDAKAKFSMNSPKFRKHGFVVEHQIVFGIDPADSAFFIIMDGGTIVKADTNISEFYGGLDATLVDLLYRELSSLGYSGVLGADILYRSLTYKDINGQKYVTFRMQGGEYACLRDSDLGRKLSDSRVGISINTKYTGNDLEEMKGAEDKTSWKRANKIKSVFVCGPDVPNYTQTLAFNASNRALFEKSLDEYTLTMMRFSSKIRQAQERIRVLNLTNDLSRFVKSNDKPTPEGFIDFVCVTRQPSDLPKLTEFFEKNEAGVTALINCVSALKILERLVTKQQDKYEQMSKEDYFVMVDKDRFYLNAK